MTRGSLASKGFLDPHVSPSRSVAWLGMLARPQLSPPERSGKPAGWSHTGGGTAAVILRKLEWSCHTATGDKEGDGGESLRNYGGEQRGVGGRPMVLVTVSAFLVFLGAGVGCR